MSTTAAETPPVIAIMRFDDRNRFEQNGIPANILFSGGEQCVVKMRDKTIAKAGKHNRFAKIAVTPGTQTGTMVDLLGPVGDYASELEAYQLFFGVKPCRYPAEHSWGLVPMDADVPGGRVDKQYLEVFSVDNESTRDIDDALSFEFDDNGCTIGIHISDVASRIPVDSSLFAWAWSRSGSAYHHGIGGDDPVEGGSVPMLPVSLAHEELSLTQGVPRNAVSLFLRVEKGAIVTKSLVRTSIVNRNATTYAAFARDPTPPMARARSLLQELSHADHAEDLVAWTMIAYNAHCGELLARGGALGSGQPSAGPAEKNVPGIIRAQAQPELQAHYVFAERGESSARVAHASLGLVNYAHCSSPIRRYADLHNQHALFGTLGSAPGGATSGETLATLNSRAQMLVRYHFTVSAAELAYECRREPMRFDGSIMVTEDGRCIRVHTPRGRLAVPLHDSYFLEPLTGALRGDGLHGDEPTPVSVELCGVLTGGGRMQLRIRAPEIKAKALRQGAGLKPRSRGLEGSPAAEPHVPLTELSAALAAMGLHGDRLAAAAARVDRLTVAAIAESTPEDMATLLACDGAEAALVIEAAAALVAASSEPSRTPSPAAAPQSDGGPGDESAGVPNDPARDDEEDDVEADTTLRATLLSLGVSDATADRAVAFGVGLHALRLIGHTHLIAALGCSEAEALAIANDQHVSAVGGHVDSPADLPLAAGFSHASGPLSANDAKAVLGYPIDGFQQSSLEVIVQADTDLLAMAPTGSGKTAVALMAILQSFRRGKKAVYTSPIKGARTGASRRRALPSCAPPPCAPPASAPLSPLQPKVRRVPDMVLPAWHSRGRVAAHRRHQDPRAPGDDQRAHHLHVGDSTQQDRSARSAGDGPRGRSHSAAAVHARPRHLGVGLRGVGRDPLHQRR